MYEEKIRIGTLVNGNAGTVDYIRQILPYGFESFSITFWQTLGGVDLARLAGEVKELLNGTGVDHQFGERLRQPADGRCQGPSRRARPGSKLIDAAHLFGCDLVTGFTGRVVGKSIDNNIPRYMEVFTPLAKRAADNGVRLAFENCDMGGNWQTGDWNIAHTPRAWELMFDALPADNIGLQWEPCHQMVKLIDPHAATAQMGEEDLQRARQGRHHPLGRGARTRHRRPGALRLPPHPGLRRQQLDGHHLRAAPAAASPAASTSKAGTTRSIAANWK